MLKTINPDLSDDGNDGCACVCRFWGRGGTSKTNGTTSASDKDTLSFSERRILEGIGKPKATGIE